MYFLFRPGICSRLRILHFICVFEFPRLCYHFYYKYVFQILCYVPIFPFIKSKINTILKYVLFLKIYLF